MGILASIQSFIAHHAFVELAVLVAVVVVMTGIMRLFKQPLIIGYIIAGILLSPSVFNLLQHTESVEMFAHVGVALLLFMVGLGLNPHVIKDLGKASLLAGAGQVVGTAAIAMLIALVLGFDTVTSIYIALALAFSSTIIVIKLLSDKGVLDELYGKMSVGILIVQDIVAMVVLMILASLPADGAISNGWLFSGLLLAKIVAVAGVSYMLTKFVLPRLMIKVAKSQEFLLIFALGRCLLYAAGLESLGFSIEIGALLAGLTMASLPYRFEIASKMKPLRDFFIVLFFVFLGSQLDLSQVFSYSLPIIIFTIFVLVATPLIVMTVMTFLGYKAKNGFLVGATLSQVSEFSFILMGLGVSIGHITDSGVVSMITVVGLLTIAGSSYYFNYSDKLVRLLQPLLKFFDRLVKVDKEKVADKQMYDIIVFGNHRTGDGIVSMLHKHKKNFIIVDYDPQVIMRLQQQGLPCLYGDASDGEFLDELGLAQVKMVVSTVHDYDANTLILQKVKHANNHTVAILSAHRIDDATLLYKQGADYVLVPHVIGGQHTAMLIENFEYDIEKYAQHKIEQYAMLQQTTSHHLISSLSSPGSTSA